MINFKTLIAVVIFLSVVSLLLFNRPSQEKHEYEQKLSLAQEVHKAMNGMMQDLRTANSVSVQGVPADGRWYVRVIFSKVGSGLIEYSLDNKHQLCRLEKGGIQVMGQYIKVFQIRRFAQHPDVLEVRLQAKNDAALMVNFKVKMMEL